MIRRLAAEGVPKARIAERLGISRNTVARAVASTEPPKYERASAEATSFTPFEERVRALLAEFPEMPATVLAERVGWSGSPSWFRENVARLRPEQRRPDPADRLVWAPGDAAQCDLWFPPRRIPLEDGTTAMLPVLVIVAAHSRFISGPMLPTRQTPDLLLGMWSLIQQFGRVPRRLIWDNEAGIGRRGRLAAGWPSSAGRWRPGCISSRPATPSPKVSSSVATGSSRRRSCPAATSTRRPTSTPSSPSGSRGRTARGAHTQSPPDRSGRRRSGSAMLALPPVPPTARLDQPDPAGSRLLRARRLQRLLRRPGRDRPPGHRHRRSGTCPGAPRPPSRRRPRPGVGPPHDPH